MTLKEEADIRKAVSDLENDTSDDELYEQKQENLNFVSEILCEMSEQDFRNFVRSIRYQRKALELRGRLNARS